MPENWFYNEVYSFSFDNVVWNTTSVELPGVVWSKLEIEVKLNKCFFIEIYAYCLNQETDIFQPMKAHAALKVSDTQIFIFGGFNEKKQCTDSSLLLDIEEGKAFPFETKGNKPTPRAYAVPIYFKKKITVHCLLL